MGSILYHWNLELDENNNAIFKNKYQSLRNEISIGECYLKLSKGLKQLLKKNKSDMFYQYFEDGLSDYIDGEITREQFWSLAKFKYPTHQIAFCTEAALKCLTFKSVYTL